MNNNPSTPSKPASAPLAQVARVMFGFMAGPADQDPQEYEAEISRMIELNGLVPFDPDMLELN